MIHNRTTEIITPATAGALTTLPTLKDTIGVTDTSADAFLTRQIVSASSWIAAVCGRAFGRETIRDTFRLHGYPGNPIVGNPDRLRVARPLVLSRDLLEDPTMVSSITINGVLLDPTLYSVQHGPGLVWHLSASGHEIPWTGGPIAVTYTSGWILPDQTGRTLPPVVEDVCLDRAGAAYFSRGRDPTIVREMVEGAGLIIYGAPGADDAADRRLDPFKLRA